MPKKRFTRRIYSLNTYRKTYAAQPYNLLRSVRVDGKLTDVPVCDVVFTMTVPTHAKFLGYFDRLAFSVPPRTGVPYENQNRPLSIPLTCLCSVWADPQEETVYVISDKSPEEVAPLSTWGDDRVKENYCTHGQMAAYNFRERKMKEYRKFLAMKLDGEAVTA